MTPPKSLHGSLDNLEDAPISQSPEERHLDGFDPDWLQAEELSNVTGPPKKDHWKVCKHVTEIKTHFGLDCRCTIPSTFMYVASRDG